MPTNICVSFPLSPERIVTFFLLAASDASLTSCCSAAALLITPPLDSRPVFLNFFPRSQRPGSPKVHFSKWVSSGTHCNALRFERAWNWAHQ